MQIQPRQHTYQIPGIDWPYGHQFAQAYPPMQQQPQAVPYVQNQGQASYPLGYYRSPLPQAGFTSISDQRAAMDPWFQHGQAIFSTLSPPPHYSSANMYTMTMHPVPPNFFGQPQYMGTLPQVPQPFFFPSEQSAWVPSGTGPVLKDEGGEKASG
jgi:hypothetical protein